MDGIPLSNRVSHTTTARINAKVIDNVLTSRSLFSRFLSNGEEMTQSVDKYTIKVTSGSQGQFVSGAENLNGAATDTTIQLQYTDTMYTIPVVIPMLDAFRNMGPGQDIDLALFKTEEAGAEAIQQLGSAFYGYGTGDQPLGLGAGVDNGTNVSTIGGQSRSTYTTLKATYTNSSGTLSLAKLDTLDSATSAAGIESESGTVHAVTKTIFDLFSQLINPAVVLNSVGYESLPLRGNQIVRTPDLKGGAGFTVLSYRGKPIIPDDAATSGIWWKLNERYIKWKSRKTVPTLFKDHMSYVQLAKPKTVEGVMAAPGDGHGFFFTKFMMHPNQLAVIARYILVGQLEFTQPRTSGQLYGITGI